eukprot:366516-Chlamydomonas_euryale.AAC.3
MLMLVGCWFPTLHASVRWTATPLSNPFIPPTIPHLRRKLLNAQRRGQQGGANVRERALERVDRLVTAAERLCQQHRCALLDGAGHAASKVRASELSFRGATTICGNRRAGGRRGALASAASEVRASGLSLVTAVQGAHEGLQE